MFSVFETLHDEHIIAVQEEPIWHLVFDQRNVADGKCEPIEGVQDCTSDCPTKIICYLKEDQSEFLEERRQGFGGWFNMESRNLVRLPREAWKLPR